MRPIRIAIVGVGNCASSLLQGLEYYGKRYATNGHHLVPGLLHPKVGRYSPGDIKVVAAFDVDVRKVAKPLEAAIGAAPNCTTKFLKRLPRYGVRVHMGPVLDGVAPHMSRYPSAETFVIAKHKPANIAKVLKDTGVEILLNYLPVGSKRATEAYATACLEAGVSLLNCIPVFIASEPAWAKRFAEKGIPIVGDDVKGQVGATILHRTLAELFMERGATVERTYQLNVGGNTDFLNMLSRDRLAMKKISKTEAVQAVLKQRLGSSDIHIGPSDYVPWQHDRKVCFLRIEGRGFGDCPIEIEARLSVEDSPNSAGVTIDAIRCLKLARERGLRGPLLSVSAWTMKHPPKPMSDEQARQQLEAFIRGSSNQ
ncbi:MAG: inositol-3-phosphate synthase [Candidatus Omnitrophica bacterium CG11_big_fil_rev_8_21_14_0_20_63_9]|nr:MAG: inositol-3-phosphate synthase [Candidatus Omnitrophica bacterium CG11_big_fil_rev_8_21_14_0_20_63_9]